MRNKVNEIMAGAKNKAAKVFSKKDAGIETLMVIALVCVVAVSLTAMFRTEAVQSLRRRTYCGRFLQSKEAGGISLPSFNK